MRSLADLLVLAVTIVAAALIGFGVPLGWIWIGSQLQSNFGSSTVNFSVAMVIFFGIVITYGVLLYVAGWLMGRADPELRSETKRSTARDPWMRGMTDTRALMRRQPLIAGIERVFVVTTLIVFVAFWLWLLFVAGDPLPSS